MKIWRTTCFILALLSLAYLLTSCGSESTDLVAGGGIGGTGYISSGTITAFGSIVVNEVTFDTTEATLYISGQEEGMGDQVIRENLGVGQVVLVEGTGNGETSSGIARRVMYSPNVIGPVTAVYDVGPKIKIFRILGQMVIANNDTIFGSGSMESIREDNVLEVSGLVDDEGRIRATYIKRIANSFDPGREIELKGLIQNLNLANKTFTINDLQISYSQAQMVNFTGGEISPGQQIHVRGRVSENYVSASMIRLTEENRITNAERADVEAIITDLNYEDDLAIGPLRVRIQENTRFMNGERRELRKGIKIRVKGKVVNKVILAQVVAFLEK
ncbi:MAG: DUF5666 domain-containing protein [Thermodesulfobacteriota bacterium]